MASLIPCWTHPCMWSSTQTRRGGAPPQPRRRHGRRPSARRSTLEELVREPALRKPMISDRKHAFSTTKHPFFSKKMGSRAKANESTAAESSVAASVRSAEATRRLFLRLEKATPGKRSHWPACCGASSASLGTEERRGPGLRRCRTRFKWKSESFAKTQVSFCDRCDPTSRRIWRLFFHTVERGKRARTSPTRPSSTFQAA